MEIIKVEGIVLTDTSYGESSKILNVLTREFGLIGIISKGCKSIRSKLRSVSNKLVYGDFNIYYKSDGLSTLISVDVIDSFKNIMTDINRIGYATYISELTYQVVKQTDDGEVFDIYINTLKKINEMYNPRILTNILELKILSFLGVAPVLDECCICGNTNGIITVDVSKGGYVCRSCYNNEKILNDKTIKLLRMFYYVDISRITKLEVDSKIQVEIDSFIQNYYDHYTGLYLKSKKFLDKISIK